MHQPIHTKSALLSTKVDLQRLGLMVRIMGREYATCPVGVEWLLTRCHPDPKRRNDPIDTQLIRRSDYGYI